ncbi:unnamed protein product, partial [Phaeothamnion confervicola]
MSRLREVVDGFPLATLTVLVVCVVVEVVVFLFEPDMLGYALNARSVLYAGEYYRILTAAVMHAGLRHILFNMMSMCAIGSGLEATIGTLGLAFTILWSIVLCGVIYVTVEWGMTFVVTGDEQYLLQNAVGFSGVIFTLALLESFTSAASHRSVFGFFQVPTRLYPFVLLLVLQFMMPGVSMAGHLGGIIVGLLHVYGATRPLLPSPAFLKQAEGWPPLRGIVARRNFVPVPAVLVESPALLGGATASFGGAAAGFISGMKYVVTACWWVISTCLHIVGIRTGGGGGSSGGGGGGGG